MKEEIEAGKTCCFTGHRLIPYKDMREIEEKLSRAIVDCIMQGYTNFIAGGALGFDSLAANTVINIRKRFPQIRLIMALPCRDQHSKWAVRDQIEYRRIINLANDVICLNEKYCTGCMHMRNRFMVDHSGICIAYLTHMSGGTAYTARYAAEKGVKVINIAMG